jgi:hypothetical protein
LALAGHHLMSSAKPMANKRDGKKRGRREDLDGELT